MRIAFIGSVGESEKVLLVLVSRKGIINKRISTILFTVA